MDTVALKVSKDSSPAKDNTQERNHKVEQTLLEKKDQKRRIEAKEIDTKSKAATNAKAVLIKTQAKLDASDKKVTIKGSTKITRPTIGQVLLKHEGRKQEEARKGKTTVMASKKVLEATDLKLVKDGVVGKSHHKSDQLKDEPQTNVTQSDVKKPNGTSKIVTILTKVPGTNKTRSGKDTMEQSTLAEKNVTQSSGPKRIKKVKVDTINVHTVDDRNTDAGKITKGKVTQRSQYKVNVTITAGSEEASQNKTTTQQGSTTSPRRTGGSGLGSVKVVNISSYSFTVTWTAPQGMFKNFTVIRREPRAEGDEDEHDEFEEEALAGDKAPTAKNTTEIQAHSESANTTATSGKAVGSRSKAETKRITMVVPGSVRSVEFSNLRANTRYFLHIYGAAAAERKSKIHRVIATTGECSNTFNVSRINKHLLISVKPFCSLQVPSQRPIWFSAM